MRPHRALLAGFATLVLVAASAAWGGPAQASVPSTTTAAPAAACTSSVGPGIPPPASVPSGIPGFHVAWYGQSGYMTLCPGDTATATVAMYNSGSRGWVSGAMGEVAYLGTSNPSPGQDMHSVFGGDGTMGSPNTGWPRYNRVAIQPAAYVGPNQVAWFQFGVKAPSTPGSYGFHIRPLIEGAEWMEDYGIFWQITVPEPSGPDTTPPSVTGASTTNTGTLLVSYSEAMKCSTDGALSSIATGTNYQITTNPGGGGTVVAETITAAPNSGCTQATLTLSNPLTLGGQYSVTTSNVQDPAGNAISSSGRSASFTVTDASGAPSATAAVTGSNQLTVTYSEPMDTATTGTVANYRLDSVSCSSLCSSVSTTSTTAVLTFTVAPTAGNHVFDISNVKDVGGTLIAPDPTSVSLSFPSSTTRPTATGASAGNATTVNASYSTNMDPLSAQTAANYGVQNASGITYSAVASAVCSPSTTSCTSVSLTLATALTSGSYNAVISNVKDTFGNIVNPNPTTRAFTFTTSTTPPTVSSITASQTAAGTATLSVTYSKAMKSSIACGSSGTPPAGAGPNLDNKGDYAITGNGGTDAVNLSAALQAASSASITADCRSVTYTLSGNLLAGGYTLQVSGAQDQSGNTIVTATQPFSFTDAVAPTVTATRIDANDLRATFSKPMTGGSNGTSSAGNTTNYQVNNLGYGVLCQSGGGATITATADLKQFTITCTGAVGVWAASGNSLAVRNAADYNGNAISPNPSSVAF